MYNDTYQKIINFSKQYMTRNNVAHWSYTDYSIHPDWAGGGMYFTIEWDGNNAIEEKFSQALEDYFYGVSANPTWGKWDHQMFVQADEKVCR